jgi:hypothetical protein
MVVVVVANVADVAPTFTLTDAGTVSIGLVLVSVTDAPPVGATLVRVTVQVLEAFCPRLAGLHASDDTTAGPIRLMGAVAEPLFNVALTTAP